MQAKVSGLMSFYKFYKMPYLFCTCLFQMRGLVSRDDWKNGEVIATGMGQTDFMVMERKNNSSA